MLTDCNYNKTKVFVDLHKLAHFINKHAIPDAHKEGHPLCVKVYEELLYDIQKHTHKLHAAIDGLNKEGKYYKQAV